MYDPVMSKANEIFNRNLDRHGFSFTPLGIYKAAFNDKGQLTKNWTLKMRQHQPSQTEHPDLYQPPRYAGMGAATQSKCGKGTDYEN